MSKKDGILDLVVKGEWFDKIKSGEKTHEFREINRYWDQRLEKSLYPIEWKNGVRFKSTDYKAVRFRHGYAKDAERMSFSIKSISIVNGLHTDLHTDGDVFDIELGEPVKPKFSDGQEVFVVFFRRIWLVRDCTILSHKQQGDSFTYTIVLGKYSLREHSFPEDRLFQTKQEAVAEAKERNEIQKNPPF